MKKYKIANGNMGYIHMKYPISVYQHNIGTTPHCAIACEYVASQPSLKAAWYNCEKAGWLWWIVSNLVGQGLLHKKYNRKTRQLRQRLSIATFEGDTLCDTIRKEVPYLAVRRAFGKYTRQYDKEHPIK